jgi:TonB-dependent starch-binding outer membrane protein SusC
MKRNVFTLWLLIACSLSAAAQVKAPGIRLAGKVVATEENSPVAGATLRLKKQRINSTSAGDGSFLLVAVSSDDTLVISHVNFITKELSLPDFIRNGSETISLDRTPGELEEVVMHTGFQNISKEKVVGAFTKIDNTMLNLQVGSNIINRLEGITPGVQFDKNPNRPQLTVRGLSSINGPKEPLIILDNFPYAGTIDNINPNDVESITILKDAAAASIWGTRAGNGVIVISTKKGKLNQPMKVEFNSNITTSGKPDLEYLPNMRTSDIIDIEQLRFDDHQYDIYDDLYPMYNYFPALSPVIEILLAKRRGDMSADEANTRITALRDVNNRNDFRKYFYTNPVNQQYSLNVQGGSKDIAYYISGGYDYNKDNLSATNSRETFSSQFSFRPARGLTITTGFRYTAGLSRGGAPPYFNFLSPFNGPLFPYASLADANGNALPFDKRFRSLYTDTVGAGKLLDWNYYPLDDYKHVHKKTSSQDLVTDIGVQYQVLKDISLDVKYQYENQQVSVSDLSDIDSYAARNLINTFSQVDYSTGDVFYSVPPGGILNTSHATIQSQNLRGQLNYSRGFGKHQVAIFAGAEVREVKETASGTTTYGFIPDILQYTPVDFVNDYPVFPNGSDYIPDGTFFTGTINRFSSVFANANYTYNDKYILFGSLRRDASNLFGVNTNDKWTPLWSAGIGWNISKEPFFHVPAISYLKLRASYGFSGNADLSRSAVTTMRYLGVDFLTRLLRGRIEQFANPELRSEKVNTINLGADFELKNARLSGSINYYLKKATDLFGLAPIDITNGLLNGSVTKNVADMRGRGFELSLSSRNIVTRDFNWTSGFNLCVERNRVTDYFQESATNGYYVISDGIRISPWVGRPLYSIVSYAWAGLDPANGDPRGILNKEVTKNYSAIQNSHDQSDLVFGGSARPTVYGNLLNGLSWKGLTLSVNITYQLGYYFRKNSIGYQDLVNSLRGHKDYEQRWQKPGDETITNVPSFVYPVNGARDVFYQASDILVKKGDHIRLQFIDLSYTVPFRGKMQHLIDRLTLYTNASNLGIIWRANKDGIDPQYGDMALPAVKTIAFGMRANF